MVSSAEKLISLVEVAPTIWDKTSLQYKDRLEKEKEWEKVAREMVKDWDGLTKSQQRKKMGLLKNKWKNIRDSLKKYEAKKSEGVSKKKKYIHFQALAFLRRASDKRRTSAIYDSDGSSSDESEVSDSSHVQLEPSAEALQFETCAETPHHEATNDETLLPSFDAYTKPVYGSPTHQPEITLFQKALVKALDIASSNLSKLEDADHAYLLSILPDYKNLVVSKKWEFRQYVADFFRHAYKVDSTAE